MKTESLLTNRAFEYKSKQPLTKETQTNKNVNELHLVRRLDWRFLLPNPQLNSIAYIGNENKTLFFALQHFSENLHCIDETSVLDEDKNDQSFYDLVVVRSLRFSDIEKACLLLKEGGCLYWELERKNWLTSLNKTKKNSTTATFSENGFGNVNRISRNFQKYKESLESLGFVGIEINWHRPNFENCLEIIPFNDHTALDYYFSRDRTDLAGQLKIISGRLMMKSGILKYVVPCVSVVACKGLS